MNVQVHLMRGSYKGSRGVSLRWSDGATTIEERLPGRLSMRSVLEEIQERAPEGYDRYPSTYWLDADVIGRDGEVLVATIVAIQPDEPRCEYGSTGHDWQRGQIVGSGGGHAWTETCLRCGCRRHHTTWPQRADTGETMPGDGVSYEVD